MQTEQRYLSFKQASTMFNVSRRTLYYWASAGLETVKIRGTRRVELDAIERFKKKEIFVKRV